MRMLSYRGPSAPGGVSNALTQIFSRKGDRVQWWYFDDCELLKRSSEQQVRVSSITETLKVNHYQYCNNFLWPVLHDLPQFAHYDEMERQSYRGLNAAVAARLREDQIEDDGLFVNDYQFALVPHLMNDGGESLAFWHIPWPEHVYEEHIAALAEVAVGLVSASTVGFHTQEYVDNFLEFVRLNLTQYEVDEKNATVLYKFGRNSSSHKTKCVVAPLGLDTPAWKDLAKRKKKESASTYQCPYVLSIDRCDYTKGIAERLEAIVLFFEHHPQWRTKVFFLQLGTRSRQGLPEFDRYWQRCRQRAEAINSRWSTEDWQPLVWLEDPMFGEELATLYSEAEVMLVSPVRDGLNLTAKEFAACQRARPGVLALSRQAGVWHELKEGCVAIDPANSLDFAHTIARCLQMSETEKYRRNHILKKKLERNTLNSWWHQFERICSSTFNREITEKVCG